MKCQDFELRVKELVGRGTPIGDSALIGHAERCSSCKRRLEEERQLEAHFSRLSEQFEQVLPAAHLKDRIWQTMRSEIEVRRSLHPGPVRRERTPHWLLAAAAVLLTVAAGWLYFATTREIGPSSLQGPDHAQLQSSPASPSPAHPLDVAAPGEQMYSEFIPIGNCRSVDCLDRALMMRIDLPRSSVAYFGIPKTRIRSRGDRIAADVLVGDDGIARAIRFVY